MGNPIVHFEIVGPDQPALTKFYEDLFGWKLQHHPEMSYSIVDTDSGEGALAGGIGGAQDGNPAVRIYVGVPDINAYLEKAEAAGGRTLMPREELPMVTLAMFADPQGNVIGLVEG